MNRLSATVFVIMFGSICLLAWYQSKTNDYGCPATTKQIVEQANWDRSKEIHIRAWDQGATDDFVVSGEDVRIMIESIVQGSMEIDKERHRPTITYTVTFIPETTDQAWVAVGLPYTMEANVLELHHSDYDIYGRGKVASGCFTFVDIRPTEHFRTLVNAAISDVR